MELETAKSLLNNYYVRCPPFIKPSRLEKIALDCGFNLRSIHGRSGHVNVYWEGELVRDKNGRPLSVGHHGNRDNVPIHKTIKYLQGFLEEKIESYKER